MQEKEIDKKYIRGLVSVVIPTYKRPDKLRRAVMSVLNQSYPNLEVLVVNDNENDDEYTKEVLKVIESISDDRLKLLFQEKHINGAAARNVGIRSAKGEYIAFLDDDDYWDLDKLEIQVNVLEKLDESYGGVSCLNRIYVNGKLTSAGKPYKDGEICRNILMRRCEVSTITILLRHSALDQTGYFDENLRRHQEVQLLSMFTTKYKLKLVRKYMCNVDSTTADNQPDPYKMEKIKMQFLESVKPAIDLFPKKIQNQIYIMNKFDIGMVMMKRGLYKDGFKRCLPIFRSPFTFAYALEHIYRKACCRLLCNYMVKDKKEYVEV